MLGLGSSGAGIATVLLHCSYTSAADLAGAADLLIAAAAGGGLPAGLM